MRLEGIMKRYYGRRIEGIPDAPRPETGRRPNRAPEPRRFRISWEDALGIAVTAACAVQWLMPDHWFLIGPILPVIRLGF